MSVGYQVDVAFVFMPRPATARRAHARPAAAEWGDGAPASGRVGFGA